MVKTSEKKRKYETKPELWQQKPFNESDRKKVEKAIKSMKVPKTIDEIEGDGLDKHILKMCKTLEHFDNRWSSFAKNKAAR
jgi:hypothetical protein